MTNALAQTLEKPKYRPFGGVLDSGGTTPKGLGFAMMEAGDLGSSARHYDDHARHMGAWMGRFLGPDRLSGNVEDPQSWNRYTYARNNPLKYVDLDGKDFRDFADGFRNALFSNQIGGIGRSDNSHPDFRLGQAFGDAAAFIGGAIETLGGSTLALGGGSLEVASLGGSTPVSIPALAGGAALATNGVITAGTAFGHMMSSANGSSTPGKTEPTAESTPTTDKREFGPVRGTDAKVNKKTGEIWVKDALHKNHYEVYRSKKDFENGTRDRAVWTTGKLKEVF